MFRLVCASLAAVAVSAFSQDPCAGCNEEHAVKYQRCAMQHGDPCAEVNEDGIVTETGKKKDVACCMKKEKHDRCMSCRTMDCEHGTCSVNKVYYRNREAAVAKDDKDWDKKAMKESGWGF